jgi:fatty acid desaturase
MDQVQCTPNINRRERRKRLIGGLAAMFLALVILALLLALDAGRWWRLPILFLFWGAAVGYFQWRDET